MKKKISYLLLICLMLIPIIGVKAAGFSSDNVIPACGFDYMPSRLPKFTSGLYNIVKLLVPVILIVMGMIDFTKAMMANDEKKMKDAQKSFITRLIASVIIFLVMAVVQFVFKSIDIGTSYKNGFVNCVNCILNGDLNSCGNSTGDLRKTCSSYEGRNCPPNDDYGNKCVTYDNGSQYGGCKIYKSDKCSDYDQNRCNSSSNSAGAACEYVGGSCREKCEILSITDGTCSKYSHCKIVYPQGSGSTTPSCVNK